MKPGLTVCLDNVRSAYNVGSIFRTADAAGVEALALCGITPFPPHPKLQKTALGSLDTVSWTHHCDTPRAVAYYRHQGFKIIVMETVPQAISLFSVPLVRPVCMVFGNEIIGVNPAVLAQADQVLTIPQYGSKESLNIATAAGIAIYEWRRQIDAR